MVIAQGDVWWANLGRASGSAAAYERPVAVVQADSFNRSKVRTTVVVPLTRTLRLAASPGNVLLKAGSAGLPHDSVANVSLITAVDKEQLRRRVGQLSPAQVASVLSGVGLMLGRPFQSGR